tara:strand:+ start:2030 stop:2422 length:393 start_codon:yes stop_codon:yes gene_type:complete
MKDKNEARARARARRKHYLKCKSVGKKFITISNPKKWKEKYSNDPIFRAKSLQSSKKYHSKKSTKAKTNLRVRRRYAVDEFFRLQKSFYNRRFKIKIKLSEKLPLKEGVLAEFLAIAKKLNLPDKFEDHF